MNVLYSDQEPPSLIKFIRNLRFIFFFNHFFLFFIFLWFRFGCFFRLLNYWFWFRLFFRLWLWFFDLRFRLNNLLRLWLGLRFGWSRFAWFRITFQPVWKIIIIKR